MYKIFRDCPLFTEESDFEYTGGVTDMTKLTPFCLRYSLHAPECVGKGRFFTVDVTA